MHRITLAPFLKGPSTTITFTPQDGKWTVTVRSGRKVRFTSADYRPAPSIDLDTREGRRRAAEDVIGFATSYVSSPAEFDREPTDIEQANREWWVANGDALSAMVGE
jgi:hypothetical protein